MNRTYLKLVTYNVNGLPGTIDLSTLPWVLRPLAWVYKLIKGSYLISLGHTEEENKLRARKIGYYLNDEYADIVALQEDFNYHEEISYLMSFFRKGKHLGGFDLSKIFSTTECWSYFPFPRFKADGLSFFAKSDRITIDSEHIVRWDKSYGYISHANDLLTHKGFRLYELTVNNAFKLDVYIVHMDADFYDKGTCPDVQGDIIARRTQLTQLTNYIMERKAKGIWHPIVIMGDTNCYPKNEWDVENIRNYLAIPFTHYRYTTFYEAIPMALRDVDRMFIINDIRTKAQITVPECGYDTGVRLSDHMPFTATLRVEY